jgi:hemerythrin
MEKLLRILLSQTSFTWGDQDQMEYQWDSTLETGYEKVDKQHKQLVVAVNNLMEANAKGKGDAAVLETLDFLTGYAIKHFADEEHLQIDYNYPDYLNHKRLHDEFKIVVGELNKRVSKEGPTKELIDTVSSAVGSWLLNHIKGDDFRMAAFIKAADSAAMQTEKST